MVPTDINLTLLLTGGQQESIAVRSDDPVLKLLYDALLDGSQAKQLFQIPIRQRQAMLTFPSDRLVGLISDPPIQIADPVSARLPSLDRRYQQPIVSKYLQIDNFFSAADNQRLLEFVDRQQASFVPTTTASTELDYRKSMVLYNFPEFSQLILQNILDIFPDVLAKLELPYFNIQKIESQLTAHNDGHYYKIHNDNGSTDTADRELTFVYYFHTSPKAFTNGELKIYDSKVENGFYVQADTFHTIEPRNNSIVFFPSRYLHEVLPISCPSRSFTDGRFTINGWIRHD